MDRNINSRQIGLKAGLIITTALASLALSGCTTSSAPRADTSFSKAKSALEAGNPDKAVVHAEAAVLSEPRNPGFRAMLGAAYLDAGRFEAAATSFNDALELGDTDPRTTLSYALAAIAVGDSASAIAALEARENRINPADFGLAMALAGNPEKGIHVLTNALRGGQNTAKVRQNLAYTYALAGNWRAARVMVAEDVPADQIDARLTSWAADAKPEDVMKRVAKLLGVTPSAGDQPGHLALSNFASQEAMIAEAAAQADYPVARELTDADLATEFTDAGEAQPSQSEALAFGIDSDVESGSSLETIDPTVANILRATGAQTASQPSAVAAAAPAATEAPAPTNRLASARFVSTPVVQKLPERAAPAATAPRRVASAPAPSRVATPKPASSSGSTGDKSANSHLVQLGSYSSRADANSGWAALQRKFPELKNHDVVITKAQVKGKIYYRVAAAGFGPRSARNLCGTVKSAGRGCFAYASSNPPKGAIDNGVRIAARSR